MSPRTGPTGQTQPRAWLLAGREAPSTPQVAEGQCHPMLLAVALTSVGNDQLAGQGQGHNGVLVDQSREAAWGERETVSTGLGTRVSPAQEPTQAVALGTGPHGAFPLPEATMPTGAYLHPAQHHPLSSSCSAPKKLGQGLSQTPDCSARTAQQRKGFQTAGWEPHLGTHQN